MKALSCIALALVAAAAVVCATPRKPTPKPRIITLTPSQLPISLSTPIGGKPKIEKQLFGSATISTSFPWPASITINKPLPPFFAALCSGALLNSFYLLTSALCALPQANLTVFLGPVNPASPAVVPNTMSFGVPAANAIPYPGFNSSNPFLNNIGLIKLPFPAPTLPPFSTLLQNPIFNLPSPIDLLSNLTGQASYLNGLAQNALSSGASGINSLLNWASTLPAPNVNCQAYYSSFGYSLSNEAICLLNNITGTVANSLQVNSGSPLITFNQITGAYVLRAINALASNGTAPLVFTKLNSLLTSWILATIPSP